MFHSSRAQVIVPEIKINNSIIENVACFNFLGVTIDQHLKFDVHMNNIAIKMSRIFGLFNKLKNSFLIVGTMNILSLFSNL